MTPVQRLGGEACAYYSRGRCTRTISPEDSVATRCTLMEARRKLGASTLDRLERLKNLSDPADREVARRHVIQKNLDAITQISCPRYVPANRGGVLCIHQHLIYCLLLMPKCEGRCDYFFHATKQTTEAETG